MGRHHHHRSRSDRIAIVVSIRVSFVAQGDLCAAIAPRGVFSVATARYPWEGLSSIKVLHEQVCDRGVYFHKAKRLECDFEGTKGPLSVPGKTIKGNLLSV